MEQMILGIVLITVGTLIIVFRDKYAQAIFNFQNKVFGFRYGSKKDMAYGQWYEVVFGSLVIVLGVLSLLGLTANEAVTVFIDYIT